MNLDNSFSLESQFKDDVERLRKELEAVRSKYPSEDQLLKSSEWQAVKAKSDLLMQTMNKTLDDIQEVALARMETEAARTKRMNRYRNVPVPVAAIIIVLFVITIIYSALK